MSYHKSKIKADYITSSFLMGAAVILLFFAGKVVTSPQVERADLHRQAQPITKVYCEKSLKKIGVSSVVRDKDILVIEKSSRSLVSLVERASLIAQTCSGFEITEFCVGDNCLPEKGLKITLTHIEG